MSTGGAWNPQTIVVGCRDGSCRVLAWNGEVAEGHLLLLDPQDRGMAFVMDSVTCVACPCPGLVLTLDAQKKLRVWDVPGQTLRGLSHAQGHDSGQELLISRDYPLKRTPPGEDADPLNPLITILTEEGFSFWELVRSRQPLHPEVGGVSLSIPQFT